MKQVKIQSTTTIHVSKNLEYKDFTATNPDPQNKLKIVADWTRNTVCIKAGVDYYPAEIAEWDAVKALEKANVLTIGEVTEKKTKKEG